MHKLGEDVERFLTPTESLPSLNFTLDSTGIVLAVNPVGLQHLGYGVEDAIEQPIFSLFHPEDRVRLQTEFMTFVQTPDRAVQGQFCLLTKGGSTLPINVTLQALQGIARHTVFLLTCQGISVAQTNKTVCEIDYVYDFNEIANAYSELHVCQRIKEELPENTTSLRQAQERVAQINECFLSFSSDPVENINRLTALAGTLLGATCALYNRFDRGMLRSIGQWQPPFDYNPIETPDGRMCWDAIQQAGNEPVVIRNLPDTPYAQTDPNVKRYRLRTYIGQAVKCQGVSIGSLCTIYQHDFIPSDDDKKLLAMIASAIGVEEERRQADEELALRHRELLALHKISEIHLSNRSLNATFQEIVEEISTATGFPIVAIEIYDQSRQMMVFEAVKGIELPPNTDVLEVPVDQTFSGTVVRTGQPAIKFYAPQEAKACDENETLKQLGIRTFICMPMSVSDRAIGTLSLAHPEVLQLDDYLIQWLASLANYLAFLIERKRSEEALRESEVRLHRVLQNMPVMLDAFDSHGNIIVWNRECERVTGYSADEIVGNPRARELLYPDPDYRQRMMAAWAERGHHYRDWEWQLTCKDGTVKTIAWSNASQLFPIPGWAAWSIGMDVTKRKRAEAALRQQKEVLQTIFEHLPVMLGFFDPQGKLQWINRAWEQTLGWKLEELQTNEILAEFYPDSDYRQSAIDFIQSATQSWGDFKTRIRDGRVIDTAWANVRLSDGSTIGIGQDITERKQAEEALRQRAEREKLIASITQHIRQSLNLEEILDTTVGEVRQFLQADRVLVYRLKADGTGSAVTEAVVPGWPTVLSRTFPEEVFPHEFHQLYSQGRICAICDLEQAQVHACLVEFLHQFQVRAKLVVPILQGKELWGLLIAHQCSSPRQWQPFEIDLLKQLAAQVAIAIQQSQLYQQTQLQAQREQMLNRVIQTIRKSLDLKTIFSTATAEIAQLLKAERATIVQYLPEQKIWLHVADYCQSSDLPSALGVEIPDKDNEVAARLKRLEVIRIDDATTWEDNINRELAQTFPGAWLLVPLHFGSSVWGSLTLVRNLQLNAWQDWEVELTCAVADQVAIAIQQSELFRQIQRLNVDLERQVQARTAELRIAFEFEATLKRITDRVRDSLDVNQILQAAVQELALGLGVICCNAGLYDLDEGTSTICYEYDTSGSSSQGHVTRMEEFAEIYAQILHGECFQFCLLVPNPVRGQVAMLTCPIFDDQGVIGDLWLVNHKYCGFHEQDIRLVQQVANQCAIAIRQARLYQASQAQIEELEKLNHLKDDFLSTVSHELRTPVCNIKMAAQMLEIVLKQAGLFDTESSSAVRYFQILNEECQREISLINNLLDLSRLEAGTEPLMLTKIDPKIWILSISEPFIERAREQQQELNIDIPATLPTLTTDLSDLERILTELLNNACKYTPPNGTITVSAQATTHMFQLKVSNTGIEIPEGELAHIFDKFYRVPNNDPWKHGGTGLGLALVKKLVEHLGGTIQVKSAAGQTMFTLQFPLST